MIKNCELFSDKFGNDARDNSIGCSGPFAMNLTVCKKQVEKQWRQQVVMITLHGHEIPGVVVWPLLLSEGWDGECSEILAT